MARLIIKTTRSDYGGFTSPQGGWSDTIQKPKYDHTLVVNGERYGVGVVPRGQWARKVYQGPLVEGPWGFTYKQSTVIAASYEMSTAGQMERDAAKGLVILHQPGDTIEMDGTEYRLIIDRRGYIELEAVGEPVAAR